MSTKPTTIEVRISRDELVKDQHKGNQAILGLRVMRQLRERGVPVIGILAPFGVEHGALTITMDDGLDGDEMVYTWTGVPIPQHLRQHVLTFQTTLADILREEEEL